VNIVEGEQCGKFTDKSMDDNLFLAKEHLARKRTLQSDDWSPAKTFLELSGSRDDDRTSKEIVKEINRRSQKH